MLGGTKILDSSGWMEADQQQRSCALGIRSQAKRIALSLFRAIDRVPKEAGVLLTFDDGPDPEVTPRVLDLLAQYNAKAIFFVVGNRIPRAPEMLKRIVSEGHWIGNHTFRHPLNGIPGLADYYRDVRECQAAIQSRIGVAPRLFRPPLGALTAGSLLAPKLIGLTTMMWSIDVGDWNVRNEADAIRAGERLGETVNSGDVVLLHDDNRHVLKSLARALAGFRERRIALLNDFQACDRLWASGSPGR